MAAGSESQRADNRNIKAVVAGINNYGGINDLPSCVEDARTFADTLVQRYGVTAVSSLFNDDVTVGNLKTSLERMFDGSGENDRLIFYFSGHGSTARKGNFIEESIVVHDSEAPDKIGFVFGQDLVSWAQNIPVGILTVVLDSCFSGGLDKNLLKTVRLPGGVVDRTHVKAYTRPDSKTLIDHADDQEGVAHVLRFDGEMAPNFLIGSTEIANDLTSTLKALIPAPPSPDDGRPRLNGLLLSACLPTETAAASTSLTEGKSAFTFCLLDSLKRLGMSASVDALMEATQKRVKSIGLTQTPLVKEPPRPTDLGERSFITFDTAVAAPSVATDPLAAVVELLRQRSSQGGSEVESSILPLLLLLASRNQGGTKDLSSDMTSILPIILPSLLPLLNNRQGVPDKGIGDLLPVLLPLLLKGGESTASEKGIGALIPTILPLILKGDQSGPQGKLFGIDDAILIPAIVSVATAVLSKGSSQQKLFGIDDAILIPAIASIAAAALSKGSSQQKLFGIDDAILIPAIVSIAAAAIRR